MRSVSERCIALQDHSTDMGFRRVLESLKAGRRLPEAQFSNITLAAKGQKSVYGMFAKEVPSGNPPETSDAGASKLRRDGTA